jgi:tetratricopeptide (TPR) repeat protein
MVVGIGTKLDAEDTPARQRKPVNPDAYDAYLKAKIMFLESTKEPEQAVRAAEQVIELYPDFAPGYALLANLYGYLVLTNNPTHDDAYLRARKMARKAIELDPEQPEARFALARVHY